MSVMFFFGFVLGEDLSDSKLITLSSADFVMWALQAINHVAADLTRLR